MAGGRLVVFAAGPLLTVSLVGVAAGAGAGIWFAGRIPTTGTGLRPRHP